MTFKERNIKQAFKYHENKLNKSNIQFGWIDGNLDEMSGLVALGIALDSEKENNATSLSDYLSFFKSLTGVTPETFIKRWAPSPKELALHWKSNFPSAKVDEHDFMLSLAYLIRDHKPFQMYGFAYEVVNIDPTKGDAS